MTKKHIHYFSLFFGLSLYVANVNAQTTINAASNSVVIAGKTFEYSIGEMSLIHTVRNEKLIITQGFLQPRANSSNGGSFNTNNLSNLSNKIKVYPNPTEDILFIEILDAIASQFNFQIIDATGKVVLKKNENQITGMNKFSLNLSTLASGSYFLLINEVSNQSKILTYNIQKVN